MIQRQIRDHEIIIHFQIEREIVFFHKFGHFKGLIKITLWYSVEYPFIAIFLRLPQTSSGSTC